MVKGEKLNLKKFDAGDFISPHSFYGPGYMWFWNARLSKEILSEQLHEMNSQKVRNILPLPLPKDFRPDFMPTSFEPDYLTVEFFKMYEFMVKEARRLDIKVWLYDEGGWPSGSVCGRIVRENPLFAQQSLERREVRPKIGEKIKIPDDSLSAFLYQGKNLIKKLIPGEEENINQKGIRVEIFNARRMDARDVATPLYPDLLNPRIAREFIRMTHEVNRKSIGRYFGTTIPLIFTDEPKVANPPWTDDLARDFKRKKGYDITKQLPAIFNVGQKQGMRVRIDFYDWWSERFAKAFFGQIQRWCCKNNLFFAGHLGGDGESGTLGAIRHGYGHILRILRKFDIPGVDTVWREIFPGRTRGSMQINVNHHFPKYASSVAHQKGSPWVLTESFAVYGSGLTPAQMKWITNFQYVRGITLMVIGSYTLSTKEHFMAGGRPLFNSCCNPLWKYMESFHSYTARLSYLLSLGRPVIETAVYYPVRDLWAGGPDVNKIAKSNDILVKLLSENQCDFDFIDDDILEKKTTGVMDEKLKVGRIEYHTVYVSRSKWMSEKSKEKLSEFISAGGKVLWIDNKKGSGRPEGSTCVEFSELGKHIKPLILIKPKARMIKVCVRQLANGRIYFITNEGTKSDINCTIEFNESLPMYQLDPETGNCYRPCKAIYSNGMWVLPVSLKFAGSCIIFFTRKKLSLVEEPLEGGKRLISITRGWSCQKIKEYRIREHNFEVKDGLKGMPTAIELADWRGKLGEDFSGDAEYRVSFECNKDIVEKACLLDLGEVRYACEVILNGKNLGKKAWKPFLFLIKGIVKEGKNKLQVIVTNTMANQYVTTKVFDKWSDDIVGPYHKIALGFESDSVSSGLFGPVRLLGVE